MIEEDIKEIEKIKDLLRFFKGHGWIPNINKTINVDKTIKAIEHLLQDYTRQKQINEEHQKINGELREKVKELESEIAGQVYWGSTPTKEIEKMWIPKQKIKDKIEEYKKIIKDCINNEEHYGKIPLYEHDIKILKELLQESEDK